MGMIKGEGFLGRYPLFQRVEAANPINPHSFGGGGSGLSSEAQKMTEKVFRWDYMGAAEFERGEAAFCLAFMFDNRARLVPHDSNGFYFLVREDVKDQAAEFFSGVVSGKIDNRHSLGLKNPKVIGWFDCKNGFFVSRDPALRDAVKKMFDEAATDDPVQA